MKIEKYIKWICAGAAAANGLGLLVGLITNLKCHIDDICASENGMFYDAIYGILFILVIAGIYLLPLIVWWSLRSQWARYGWFFLTVIFIACGMYYPIQFALHPEWLDTAAGIALVWSYAALFLTILGAGFVLTIIEKIIMRIQR